MYKRLLVVALVLPALQNLGGEQRPETSAPKRVNADRGFRLRTRGGFHNATVAEQSSNLPPILKQFEETSYYLRDIAMFDANTGWAVGEPHWDQAALQYKGTIVKTTNGGDSWSTQDTGVAESFNGVRFVDANQGWVVGTNGTILRTTDGGAHWVKQAVATPDEFRSVFFTDANTGWATAVRPVHYVDVYEGFDDWLASIFHTSDGGRTWTQQPVPASASLLNRIEFVDAQTGWAAGLKVDHYDSGGPQHLGAIYHTTDGGRMWTEQFATNMGFTFTAMDFVDASNGWAAGFPHGGDYTGGCTFHTSDGGTTWQVQSAGGFNEQVRALRFVDRNHGYAVGTAYVGDGTVVWRTLDGGTTWTDVRMGQHNFLMAAGMYGVAIAGDRVFVVGDRDYLARSTRPWDSCGTLATCGSACECLFSQSYINPHYLFHDVFFADQSHGWVVGRRSFGVSFWGQVILSTADGGATWKTQYEHAPRLFGFSNHRLDRVYFSDLQNGWAVGASEQGDDYKQHNGILHTADGGLHWIEQGSELYDYDIEFTAVQFLNSREGWVFADNRYPYQNMFLAHTTDGGAHWSWVDTGIGGGGGTTLAMVGGAMFFADQQHGWVSGWDGVIHTEDGGAHWVKAALSCGGAICHPEGNGIAFSGSLNGWIAGGALYRTTDGGANWSGTRLELEEGWFQDIQFPEAGHGWLAGDYGVLMMTVDGGNHWLAIDSGTPVSLQGLRFTDGQHGWIVGDYGTILSYAGDRIPAGKPAVFSVVNGASYLPGIASAAWISIFGANLSTSTRLRNGADFAGGKLPTQLDGVRVSINGQSAYPYYISPSQLNILVSAGVPEGPVTVQVSTSQGSSDPFVAQQGKYSPGVFRYSAAGGQYVIAQAADGSWIGGLDLMYLPGMPPRMREAKPGEIITLYGTGFGATNPPVATDSLVTQPAPLAAPVTFYFGRTAAEVVWAGLVGSGLYQFNIRVPDVPDGGNVIVAEIGGYRSQGDSAISVGR